MASQGRHSQRGHRRAYALALLFALVIALCAELLVFNFPSLRSMGYDQVQPTNVIAQRDVTDRLMLNPSNDVELVFDDAVIHNMYVDVSGYESSGSYSSTAHVKVSAIDEGHSAFYELATLKLSNSAYYSVNPSGKVQRLKLTCDNAAISLDSDDLQFNVSRPLEVIPLRMLVVFLLVVAMFMLRPTAPLYHQTFRDRKFLLAVGVVCAAAVAFGCVFSHIPNLLTLAPHQDQYYQLAVAFTHGHLYLDEVPGAVLQQLDNPYDPQARVNAGIYMNNGYAWDHAYFQGKYYVYFGVLPVLLFHLPFYLLTGKQLLNWVAVMVCLVAFALGALYLLVSICKRWFPHTSQAVFLLAYLGVLSGSWVVYLCHYPDLYGLPISMALALLVWGLALWVRATSDPDRIALPQAIGGSLLVALIVLCRPPLLIGGLWGIVLIAPYVRNGLRKNAGAIGLALVPFVLVFACAAAYNMARFGSPLDFGANYNLTSNDMTHRGFKLDRIPSALVAYLLQPISLGLTSPFIQPVNTNYGYVGQLITEPMYGGVFMLVPFTCFAFAIALKRVRDALPGTVKALAAVSLVAVLILVIFDANVAGILPRYICDFGVFAALPAAFCVLGWGQTQTSESAGIQPELIATTASGRYAFGTFGALLCALTLASLVIQFIWLAQ